MLKTGRRFDCRGSKALDTNSYRSGEKHGGRNSLLMVQHNLYIIHTNSTQHNKFTQSMQILRHNNNQHGLKHNLQHKFPCKLAYINTYVKQYNDDRKDVIFINIFTATTIYRISLLLLLPYPDNAIFLYSLPHMKVLMHSCYSLYLTHC